MTALGCAGGCDGCKAALAGGGCGGGMGRAGMGSIVATSAEDIRGLLIRYGVVLIVGAVAGAVLYAKVTKRRRR